MKLPQKSAGAFAPTRGYNDLIDAVEWLTRNSIVSAGAGLITRSLPVGKGIVSIAEGAGGSPYINLIPEYAGAVLWSDSNDNKGTMRGGFDSAELHNAYVWTTEEETVQQYSVVVRFTVPEGHTNWNSECFYAKTSTGAGAGTKVELTGICDTNGIYNAMGETVTSDSWTKKEFSMPAGAYDTGGIVTVIFTLFAIDESEAFLGELQLRAW